MASEGGSGSGVTILPSTPGAHMGGGLWRRGTATTDWKHLPAPAIASSPLIGSWKQTPCLIKTQLSSSPPPLLSASLKIPLKEKYSQKKRGSAPACGGMRQASSTSAYFLNNSFFAGTRTFAPHLLLLPLPFAHATHLFLCFGTGLGH